MKTYWRVEIYISTFALVEVSGQLHVPAVLPLRERVPDTNWIGGWVGPTAGLDAVEWTKTSSLAGSLLRKYAIFAVAILISMLNNESRAIV
jgi:hypothetical protein